MTPTAAAAGRPRPASPRRRARRAAILAALAIAVAMGAAMGLAFPLVSTILELRFGSGPLIGAMATVGAGSTLIGAPLAPWAFNRLGPKRALIGAALISAAAFAVFTLTTSVWAWLVLRLAFGVFATFLFVGSEVWINQLAPERWRGRLLGVYATALACGFGLGAAAFGAIGPEGPGGFILGAVLIAAPAGILLLVRAPMLIPPRAGELRLSAFFAAAATAPLAIAAATAFGAIETTMLTFLPVYGLRVGYGEAGVALIMLASAAGTILLQAPIGWAADAFGRARILIACGAFGLLFPLAMIASPERLAIDAAVVFLASGVVVSLYGVGLARLGQRFKARHLSVANAVFITAYGVGSTLSPGIAGAAIDWIDPDGVLYALSGFAGLFLLTAALTRQRAAANHAGSDAAPL